MALDDEQLLIGAKNILSNCLKKNRGVVGIIYDETTVDIFEILCKASELLDILPIACNVSIADQLRMAEQNKFDLSVVKSVLDADTTTLILCVNGRADTYPFRTMILGEVSAQRRIGHMPGADFNVLRYAAEMNLDEIQRICNRLNSILYRAQTVEIITIDQGDKEHSLYLNLPKWNVVSIPSSGVVGNSGWGNVPSGEVFILPPQEGGRGSIVINGSIPELVLKPGEEMIVHVEAGDMWVVSATNEQILNHLETNQLAHIPHRSVYDRFPFAEVGIGVSNTLLELTGNMLLDQKMASTLHVALGENQHLGGDRPFHVHCDLVTRHPTLRVNGHAIIKNGVFDLDSAFNDNYEQVIVDNSPLRAASSIQKKNANVSMAEDRLRLKLFTNAGRNRLLEIGTPETAKFAAQIWQHLPNGNGTWKPIADVLKDANILPSVGRQVLDIMLDFGLIEWR